jgi:hypothetical protein
MANHHLEHEIPERTTPQGTQEGGVDFGHEEKDVNFAPVFRWFISLAIVTGLSQFMLAGGLNLWVKHEEQRDKDRLPSPLYSVRQDIPEPRLLPNRIDSPATSSEPLVGPGEALLIFRKHEDLQLQRLGLQDPQNGAPAIPQKAIAAVSSQPASAPGGAAGEALVQPMPSSASGGTAMENRLK